MTTTSCDCHIYLAEGFCSIKQNGDPTDDDTGWLLAQIHTRVQREWIICWIYEFINYPKTHISSPTAASNLLSSERVNPTRDAQKLTFFYFVDVLHFTFLYIAYNLKTIFPSPLSSRCHWLDSPWEILQLQLQRIALAAAFLQCDFVSSAELWIRCRMRHLCSCQDSFFHQHHCCDPVASTVIAKNWKSVCVWAILWWNCAPVSGWR